MTRTQTQTRTCARAELLRLNVEVAVHRLLPDHPRELIEDVIRPGLLDRLIRFVEFWAIDDEGDCHARFRLSIDWDLHERYLQVSGRVRIDGRWQQYVAPEVSVMLESFEKVVDDRGLHVRGSVRLVRGASSSWLWDRLPRLDSHPWVGPQQNTEYQVKELSELGVKITVADEF